MVASGARESEQETIMKGGFWPSATRARMAVSSLVALNRPFPSKAACTAGNLEAEKAPADPVSRRNSGK